tara:strand:- start:2693 stop:3511 length:819 start_codon:yes stop_codon:yes gene_type:complete
MSINAGGKPIVTDKLVHLWDPLSNVSYPSGSTKVYNHFSEGHVKKITNGFGTNSTGGTKNGLAEYGDETAHQRQKGYWTSDGTSDYIYFGTSNTTLPIRGGTTGYNHPASITYGGWFKLDSSNSTTRYLFGFGGSSSSSYFSFMRVTSSGNLYMQHEPNTNYSSVSTNVSIEDDTWHLIYAVIRGTGTNTATCQIFIDGGLFTQSSVSSSISSANFLGYNSQCNVYGIGNVKMNSWQTSFLGDIGPHYIYAKELSTGEMQQNYYALIDRFNF